ncbi:alpha/beta hydrolase [Pontibacter fetidus]|uniref:Esterase n=1 Tax=Pontibacter fetidus TaxID=2700082 RepID=A0A6B2GXJ7_9BACT|nr:esterase [Pontibacter fetidus]NDK55565.1 esterase [Pontibacter fetidus]
MQTIETNTPELQQGLALQYLVRPASAATIQPKAIILLHGVGSNEQDLFSLAQLMPDDFIVISPRGPYTLAAKRYAWYEVDFATGKPLINAAQEAQIRNTIADFIAQVKTTYKVDDVYLGGFSQGAIMSYTIGLLLPAAVAGILAFSGRILSEIRPLVKPGEELQQLNVFISHGTQDATLPVQYAREAKTYLQELGVEPTYHEYPAGHQLNNQMLTDMVTWLQQK